ncbi:MAG: CBS domain-containing protein [Candidatus Nanohalobium sp.]
MTQDVEISEVMTDGVIAVEQEKPITMVRNDVSRVPVVRDDMLVGIVTQSDILRAWPGFAEIMEEEEELEAEAAPRPESRSGNCESCENYSEDLEEVNGMWLCPECR